MMYMNLEKIMLSEISQIKKDKFYMIHLCEISTTSKFTDIESRLGSTRGRGTGERRVITSRLQNFCLSDKFWKYSD